jgi:periplasmic divalent cation tolerance protein
MGGHVQVVTTVDSEEGAQQLARDLVDGRLAACVQVVGPIHSVYRWQGDVQEEREWQCVAKTTADRLDAVVEHLRRHHPYDLPEVVATPIVGGSDDYLRWVSEQV